MASPVPAKSQPLHNFDLPRTLKWNKDGSSGSHHHQRRRSSMKSPSRRPHPSPASPLRHSPLRDSVAAPSHRESPLRESTVSRPPSRESPDYSVKQSPVRGESVSKLARASPIGGDSVKRSPVYGDSVSHSPRRVFAESEALVKGKASVIEYRRSHSKTPSFDGFKNEGVGSLKSERGMEKSEKKSKAADTDAVGSKRSSRILIKIPCKNNKHEEEASHEESVKVEHSDEGNQTDEVQDEGKIDANNNIAADEEAKTWNLRPRKPIRKCLNVNGGGFSVKNHVSPVPEKSKAQSPSRNQNNKSVENEGNGGGCGGEKEKRKLSIIVPLSKEEIEEDIFAWTGAKPARRPKKRPRNVQRQVDYVLPGTWLLSITADTYKVSESSMKV